MSQSVLDLIQVNGGGLYFQCFDMFWLIDGAQAEAQVFAPNPQISTDSALPSGAQLGPTIGPDSFIFGATGGTWYLMCDGNHVAYPLTGAAIPYFQLNPNPTQVPPLVSEWILAVTEVSPGAITPPQ